MEKSLPELRLAALGLISALLTDLSDDGSADFDRDERQDYFNQVADLIGEELGLEIIEVDDSGRVIATLSPPSGW